jgi:hypothetical protein
MFDIPNRNNTGHIKNVLSQMNYRVNCVQHLLYLWKCEGGHDLFQHPSFGRNGHYSDITSRGRKRVERERGD